MRTKKINRRDFDFEAFVEAEISFIEDNFLRTAPDAADTMRYFYSFDNELNKDAENKDFSKWEMKDFKNAVLGSETIFFPFSSGPHLDGTLNLASGKAIRLVRDDEISIGLDLTDCVGILVRLEKDKFVFGSAVAWGDRTHAIEAFPSMETDKEMNRFLKSFKQSRNRMC
jgi:hypothetical protein